MKQYSSERAIISLTSWKGRIDTVGRTLFSLLKTCPGFHVVLVLSEEEFPRKEAELPDTVMAFAEQDLIEVLWVYRNVKTMKKVIFTMAKYPDVPVISADDDCIYTCNYAEDLYRAWEGRKDSIFRYAYRPGHEHMTQGPCTIYPPENVCHYHERMMAEVDFGMSVGDDDAGQRVIRKYGIPVGCVGKPNPFVFHTTEGAMHRNQWKCRFYRGCFPT